jgi:hypothetical protein
MNIERAMIAAGQVRSVFRHKVKKLCYPLWDMVCLRICTVPDTLATA